MADLNQLQSDLVDAEAALKKLRLGINEVTVEHGDMRVTFKETDCGDLQNYIDSLKAKIIVAGGTVDTLQRKAIVLDMPGSLGAADRS
jgi:hypothetical protein